MDLFLCLYSVDLFVHKFKLKNSQNGELENLPQKDRIQIYRAIMEFSSFGAVEIAMTCWKENSVSDYSVRCLSWSSI